MSQFRVRNRLFQCKVEAVSGTEETLAPATDAIRAEAPVPSPDFETLLTAEAGSSLDASQPVVGGGNNAFSGLVYVKGNGTGGSAPEHDPILRACANVRTLLAADITNTATAGSADSISLFAGDGALVAVGQVIDLTGGTGSGLVAVITAILADVASIYPDWTTIPDATTIYAVRANAMYVPASTGLETVTASLHDNASASGVNSLERKAIGCAGNYDISLINKQLGRLNWNLRGILPGKPTNVAAPAAATFDNTRPPPFIDVDAFLGNKKVQFREFTFDAGNNVQQADDPGALFGSDVAGVTDRRMVGTINPLLGLLSVRDNFGDFLDGVTVKLWLRYGETSGNKVSFYFPTLRYTGANPSDIDGFNAEALTFEASGFDSGVFQTYY